MNWEILNNNSSDKHKMNSNSLEILPQLETERLIIRQLNGSDLEFIHAHYQRPEISHFTLLHFNNIKETKEYFDISCLPPFSREFKMGIVLRDTSELIGTVSFLSWNHKHRNGELGYDLAPEYWGKDLMFEALLEFLTYLFDNLEIHRIEATTNENNLLSKKLLERLGFMLEGTMREKYKIDGYFQNELLFSLIKSEYN